MNNYSAVLVVVGSLCLTITLVLAWCLVGVRTSARVRKLFPSVPNLLKAHIDYLLTTGLLMIFYLLFAHFRLSVSPVILVAMSVGSLMNPVGFLYWRSSLIRSRFPPARSAPSWRAVSRSLRLVTRARLGMLLMLQYSRGDRKEPM
jgi:hypothetical protein